jgi:hypothetical protein
LHYVNSSIAASFETIALEFAVLTAIQAFTLVQSVKAEKLNSAIEKKHRQAHPQRRTDPSVRALRVGRSGAYGGFWVARDSGNGRTGTR